MHSEGLTRRERWQPIVAEVLHRTRGLPMKDRRKALREAFPLAERANYPYKVWLEEIRIQLGLKHPQNGRRFIPAPNQLCLPFDGGPPVHFSNTRCIDEHVSHTG